MVRVLRPRNGSDPPRDRRPDRAGPRCARSSLRSASPLLAAAAVALAAIAPPRLLAGDDVSPAPDPLAQDLTDFSLEELMSIKITSVSKKSEPLMDAAAAIFVITQDDVRRSGARTIPEALRMVPGLQVAQVTSSSWAVSARGFNSRFANKLLVLIDGRTVYTPLFSGVYWEYQDTLIEDIERIEVIRGPGGTLWGANAVNGVINIITKKAADTQGLLVSGGSGTEERAFGAVRYGGALGDDATYRVYGKYFDRDGLLDDDGDHTNDDWQTGRGGFRLDWDPGEGDRLTLQGDIFWQETGVEYAFPTLTAPFARLVDDNARVNGQNILARWTRELAEASEISLQIYYDRTDSEYRTVDETRETVDVELQHRFRLPARQEILWGLNYRVTWDHLRNRVIGFDPSRKTAYHIDAFVQDDIAIVEDRLRMTVGSKFGYNSYTGFEVQPSVRGIWSPHARHRVWAAVSRAVRTPSRVDDDGLVPFMTLPTGPPTALELRGDSDFDSEELLAIEVGYRTWPVDAISFDIAAYYNHYENLRTFEPGAPSVGGPPAHVVQPLLFDNKMEGDAFGIEVAAGWEPLDWWRLDASATFFTLDVSLDNDSGDTISETGTQQTPAHQASLRSSMDLPGNVELDTMLYWVDSIRQLDVPSYVRLDFRLGWRPYGDDRLDVSLAVLNALDSRHEEFGEELHEVATEVERSFYAMMTLRF